MAGISNAKEAWALGEIFTTGDLWLRLFVWTGDPVNGAGQGPNDDGSLPTDVEEVTGGGYAPTLIDPTWWSAPFGGGPSFINLPKVGGAPIEVGPSGAEEWQVCAYAFTDDTDPVSADNLVSVGYPLGVDPEDSSNLIPLLRTVNAAAPFLADEDHPIVERLGDAPPGVDPT